MYKDRGLKKWQGFMMPDHLKSLRKLELEEQKIKMPILDEYQLQEFDQRISFSMEYHLPVEVTYLMDGFENKISGHVHHNDPLKRRMNMKTLDGLIEYIHFENIIDVKIME